MNENQEISQKETDEQSTPTFSLPHSNRKTEIPFYN